MNSVTEDEGGKYLVHCDGKCPMLNEKGLCSVQLAYGEENISDICREHPRFYEWFEITRRQAWDLPAKKL